MSPNLPTPIATFFRVSNGVEPSALNECFVPEAVVRDERHTHTGQDAIAAWLLEAQRKYAYQVEPLQLQQRGGEVVVRARVTGAFPGSPVELDHVFRLAGEKIVSLDIG